MSVPLGLVRVVELRPEQTGHCSMARAPSGLCAAQSNYVVPWENIASRRRRRRTAQCALAAMAVLAKASTVALRNATARSWQCPQAMLSMAAAKQRSAPWENGVAGRRAHSGNWDGKSSGRRWETLQERESESTWSPQHCMKPYRRLRRP